MTPEQAFLNLKNLFQPSFINLLYKEGKRADWLQIEQLFEIAERVFIEKEGLKSLPDLKED